MHREVIVPICLVFPIEESVSKRIEYYIDLFELAIVFTDLLKASYLLELESDIDNFILLLFLVEFYFSFEVIEIPLVLEREKTGLREYSLWHF